MVPDRPNVWTDGQNGRRDGRRQNYIPPTLSGDKYQIKYIIRYYVCLKCCERLKCLCMVDLDFCITYLKNTKFDPVTYLTTTKIF